MAGGRPGTRNTHTSRARVEVALERVPGVTSLAVVSEPVDEGDEYHAGEDIEIAVTFSKPVTVTGTPGLSLLVGTSTRTASYARTTGGSTLVFSYTVASTDSDDDGVSVPENALSLNSATIARRRLDERRARPPRARGRERAQGRRIEPEPHGRRLPAHPPGAKGARLARPERAEQHRAHLRRT